MCEFQKIPPSIVINGETIARGQPMCEYTKTPCTYCILGNSKTYNEAVKRSEQQ